MEDMPTNKEQKERLMLSREVLERVYRLQCDGKAEEAKEEMRGLIDKISQLISEL